MSATTFSNMSNPDILLTIQAYTHMKLKTTEHLISIQDHVEMKDEIEKCHSKIARLSQLVDALLGEWDKRDME